MKDCLSKNNETMFRQFAEQRRLNAAFSHDLRTPLTLLKGHATMLLSFIPKGLVSQEEILDEISVMSKIFHVLKICKCYDELIQVRGY